ncbi:uncharacterized protein LOC126669311 isoform X2 [Mercurialis annua]|uniref:uncharacterized protein LOC126669311 isoform X2 n=1 Tax=Mercurialis annua TaxID=3986 RepID=UPI002160F8BF|nr:uncharacterized protein LOC126669311 isoform X2 [Mercurialis annua]
MVPMTGELDIIKSEGNGGIKKSKKRQRSLNLNNTIIDEEYLQNYYKRSLLCSSKPSYLLGLGSHNIRPENRVRLCRILQKLVGQHNWVEASGVLSILLKGTHKEIDPTINRFKYSVSMEIMKHLESANSNLMAVDDIFDTWMTRSGINISNKQKKNSSTKEDRFLVRLESILFGLMQGNIVDERQNARSLMQESEFEGHPMFNLIMGLIFFQLWYSSIPEQMQWKDSDQIYSPTYTDMSVTPQLDKSATLFSCEVGGSEGHNALINNEADSFCHCGSETSVMIGKEMPVKANYDRHKEVVAMEVDVNLQKNVQQDFRQHGFYVSSAENEVSVDHDGGRMHFEPNLSALNCAIQDDEYNHAVRYLKAAIYSTPPVLAALIPFIQLLLIGGKFAEALDELKKLCENSNSALANRLRAHILERVDPNNGDMLSTCFEDTLKNDPTCSESLDKLISLHQKGNYSPESLLEMIALHLEAVCGEHKIWKEFALCFLNVARYEEDNMSVCLHENEGEKVQGYSVRYNRIPKLFIHGRSGKAWKLRWRWWLTRHFSNNRFAQDIAAGNVELVTYKAACAAHMYGPQLEYVVRARACLEKDDNRDLFTVLQLHLHHLVGINLHFELRTC